MELTRDYQTTIHERIQDDKAFASGLLDDAIALFLEGEPDVARLLLRDLVNATIGFERLAVETEKPSKSLHRMLSANGNPTMDNLSTIIVALRKEMNVKSIDVTSVFEGILQSA